MDPVLTSLRNPKVKDVVKLRSRRARDRRRQILIEGYRELKRALDNGVPVETVFYCEALFQGSNEGPLLEQARAGGADLFATTEAVFRKMAYRDRPEGLLGLAPQQPLALADLKLSPAPLIVVAEAIEKPGNLGTILRSADATGVDAVLLCDPVTDLYNPNTVRASIGTLFSVPVVQVPTPEGLAWLRQHAVQIIAASPHAALEYTAVDLRRPSAFVVGSEQYGLSEAWLAAADVSVFIPMLGQADSLNVAMATTILLYEAVRQRRSLTQHWPLAAFCGQLVKPWGQGGDGP